MALFDNWRRSARSASVEEEAVAQPALTSYENVEQYLRGALRLVRTTDGLVQPYRFSARQMELLEHIKRAKRAIATSGIAIDFVTDGDTISFDCRVAHTLDSSSRLYRAVMEHEGALGEAEGGVIDGIDMVAGGLRSYTTAAVDGTITLSFDNPDHDRVEVRIFLPYMMGVAVGNLACNGSVEPAPERGYLLALGDSITQGFVVGCPSLTYPALVATALGLDVVNQGIAGHMFDRRTLAGIGAMRARPPRVIVVAYGTNDWARKPAPEDIRRGAERYLRRLVRAFPGVPTYVLSPLWRADENEPVPAGVPLTWVGEMLEELCAEAEQLRYVDGYHTIPKNPVMLADGRLHPGSVDAGLVADALIERMAADGISAGSIGEDLAVLAVPPVEEPPQEAGPDDGADAGQYDAADADGDEGAPPRGDAEEADALAGDGRVPEAGGQALDDPAEDAPQAPEEASFPEEDGGPADNATPAPPAAAAEDGAEAFADGPEDGGTSISDAAGQAPAEPPRSALRGARPTRASLLAGLPTIEAADAARAASAAQEDLSADAGDGRWEPSVQDGAAPAEDVAGYPGDGPREPFVDDPADEAAFDHDEWRYEEEPAPPTADLDVAYPAQEPWPGDAAGGDYADPAAPDPGALEEALPATGPAVSVQAPAPTVPQETPAPAPAAAGPSLAGSVAEAVANASASAESALDQGVLDAQAAVSAVAAYAARAAYEAGATPAEIAAAADAAAAAFASGRADADAWDGQEPPAATAATAPAAAPEPPAGAAADWAADPADMRWAGADAAEAALPGAPGDAPAWDTPAAYDPRSVAAADAVAEAPWPETAGDDGGPWDGAADPLAPDAGWDTWPAAVETSVPDPRPDAPVDAMIAAQLVAPAPAPSVPVEEVYEDADYAAEDAYVDLDDYDEWEDDEDLPAVPAPDAAPPEAALPDAVDLAAAAAQDDVPDVPAAPPASPPRPAPPRPSAPPDEQLARLAVAVDVENAVRPGAPGSHPEFDRLARTIWRLRQADGCPWDRAQTHESITRNMIEEAYEAVDAIRAHDVAHLREELGDVLEQVLLHAQIAADAGEFTLDDVCRELNEKLVRRHPHVFGDAPGAATAEAALDSWDEVKRGERDAAGQGDGRRGLLESVPSSLPALMQAQKISSRAAKVGFEWRDVGEVWEKVAEERAEFEAEERGSEAAMLEFGDLLFTLVNVARHEGIDAEEALAAACAKFRARWAAVEREAWRWHRDPETLSTLELNLLWDRAKR